MPKSKKKRFNLLYFLIFGFMLYFCFHVYFVVNAATIKTYTLDLGEISNTIEKDVLILREEYQLKAPSAGYVSYFVDEGDRVKRADLVAKIQNEELSGDEQSTLQILNRRINELKNNAAIQNPEKEIEEINNKIDFLYTDISHRIAENDISYIPDLKEQILTLMDRKKLLTGASSLGNMTVEQLEAKKAEIQNKLSSEKFYIKSINPGVLAFYSDGLQDEFSIINKDKLSVTKINKFQDKNLVSESESVNQGDVIASIINNHVWYLATEVTPEDIKVIERGKAVEIIIDKETIKAKLEDFYKGEDEKFVGLFSIEDENFDFTYAENEPLLFTENTFGTNLTAVLAYYAYVIIGLDADSYSNLGGNPFFKKAEKITNLAQSTSETGWKAFESSKNRYALINNLIDESLRPYRSFFYQYHRFALDEMHVSIEKSRALIDEGMPTLLSAYKARPSAILLQVFTETKADELVDIFSGGTAKEKKDVYETLMSITPSLTNRLERIKQ